LKRESEAEERENTSEKNGEIRQSNLTTNEINMNLAENAGKIIEEKKVRARKEDSVKKSKKQPFFFYAREERLILFFNSNSPLIVLVYKRDLF
jgi:hypothetical protein